MTHKHFDYITDDDTDAAVSARFQKMFGGLVDENGRPRTSTPTPTPTPKRRRPGRLQPTLIEGSPEWEALGEAVADEVERLVKKQ